MSRHARDYAFADRRGANPTSRLRECYVFDVGGNKLRLITAIHFNTGRVFIRYVLTHAEYDRETWKRKEHIQ